MSSAPRKIKKYRYASFIDLPHLVAVQQGHQASEGQESAREKNEDRGRVKRRCDIEDRLVEQDYLACAQCLADDTHNQQDHGVTRTHSQSIGKGVLDGGLVRVTLCTRQDYAVDHDERYPHAETFVYLREVRLQRKVNDGHERGDDHDEYRDAYLIGCPPAYRGDDDVGEDQHER